MHFHIVQGIFLDAYSNWEYEDMQRRDYCPYTPFMFAFVTLIILWIWCPFVIIFLLCVVPLPRGSSRGSTFGGCGDGSDDGSGDMGGGGDGGGDC